MKFRLLERNMWGDSDTWTARKKKYKAEINTPFRPNHQEFGMYRYRIDTPDGKVFSSYKDKVTFSSLQDCIEHIESFIDERTKIQ